MLHHIAFMTIAIVSIYLVLLMNADGCLPLVEAK